MAAFLILFVLAAASGFFSDEQILTVSSGQDVTLRCQTTNVSISAVEWTRPDLEPEYVLLNVDGHPETKEQHPSFRNRVELVDRELKDGDVSITLKNVNNNDTGTYECRVAGGSTRKKRSNIDSDPIKIIHLQVTGPQNENPLGGNPRVYFGLAAATGLLVLVSTAAIVVWRNKRFTDKKSEPAADEEPVSPLLV